LRIIIACGDDGYSVIFPESRKLLRSLFSIACLADAGIVYSVFNQKILLPFFSFSHPSGVAFGRRFIRCLLQSNYLKGI